MKKFIIALLSLLFILLAATALHAHTPEVLNYQGVLKNPDGSIRPHADATITIEFVQDNQLTYSETHHITTNANGYFSIYPGTGEALQGLFSAIDWSITPVVMRTILDGTTIAESALTSVPYALFAQRFKGEEQMLCSIDSLGEAHILTALQVDDNILAIEALQHTDDSTLLYLDHTRYLLDSTIISLDATQQLLDSTRTALHGTQHRLDTAHIEIDTLTKRVDILAEKSDSLTLETPFFNASLHTPLPQGHYHTPTTASAAVPQMLRRPGLVVTFRSDTINWRSIQFTRNDTSQWDNTKAWQNYGYFGNITVTYHKNDSLTRLSIPVELRRQGIIISYFKDNHIKNEQYIATAVDDTTWSREESWMRLQLNSDEIDKMHKEIARIDSMTRSVKQGLDEMSTFGAWFYTYNNHLFTHAGAIDYNGRSIENIDYVSSALIPIDNNWHVTTYANEKLPGISFFRENNWNSRIATAHDNVTGNDLQKQTFDFSIDYIPEGATYFAVNMPLSHQSSCSIKQRNIINDVIDTSPQYVFKELNNFFNYVGAYVAINGKRVISSGFRHSRFISLNDGDVYKINSYGMYNNQYVMPVIVYYRDADFNSIVDYDLGNVESDRYTSRELIISRESAPTEANYFIVNWQTTYKQSRIFSGQTTHETILNNNERISSLETDKSCYAQRKLVTIGDSYTTNSGNKGTKWQEWLVKWLGVEWSEEETMHGVNGHFPMGVGGAWIMPNNINSIAVRSLDMKYYSPEVIILYGGQNDQLYRFPLGSINDEPFIPSKVIDLTSINNINTLETAIDYLVKNGIKREKHTLLHYIDTSGGKRLFCINDTTMWENTSAWHNPMDNATFYSAYKGIVERICASYPYATLYCTTLMLCDSTRYDGTPEEWDELCKWSEIKSNAIKEIAQYYGVQIIDLYNKSGVTPYNAASLYFDWIHPNLYGYRRLAECMYRHMR